MLILDKPDAVVDFIDRLETSWNSKKDYWCVYRVYCEKFGLRLSWKPRIKKEVKIGYVPSERQVQKILETKSLELRVAVKIAVETGVRRGELLNLRFKDFDFKRRVVLIKSGKAKGVQKFRQVLVSDELLGLIRRWKHLNLTAIHLPTKIGSFLAVTL